jgi:hypothetical protein
VRGDLRRGIGANEGGTALEWFCAAAVVAAGSKRAVVAVARKLSVLLHRLWVSAEVYDPLYNTHSHRGLAA